MNTKRVSIIWKVSRETFTSVIASSRSYREALTRLGYSTGSAGNLNTLKKRIQEEHIDDTHIKFKPRRSRKLIPLANVLVENSTYQRRNLKRRLVLEGLLKHECCKCGNSGHWQGDKLVLQLDHENGINNDNRLSNLRLLCPNCHSQTKNFSGRNRKPRPLKPSELDPHWRRQSHPELRKVPRPSYTQLVELVKKYPMIKIGSLCGVSDNAVRKWCKSYGIPATRVGIKSLRKPIELGQRQPIALLPERCETSVAQVSVNQNTPIQVSENVPLFDLGVPFYVPTRSSKLKARLAYELGIVKSNHNLERIRPNKMHEVK